MTQAKRNNETTQKARFTTNLVKMKLIGWHIDFTAKIYRKLPEDIYVTYRVFSKAKRTIEAFMRLQPSKKNKERLYDTLDKFDVLDIHFTDNYSSLIYALEILLDEFRVKEGKDYESSPTDNVLKTVLEKHNVDLAGKMSKEIERAFNYPFYEKLEQWGIKPEGVFRNLGTDILDLYEIACEIVYAIRILLLLQHKDENMSDLIFLIRTIYSELLHHYPDHLRTLRVAIDVLRDKDDRKIC